MSFCNTQEMFGRTLAVLHHNALSGIAKRLGKHLDVKFFVILGFRRTDLKLHSIYADVLVLSLGLTISFF